MPVNLYYYCIVGVMVSLLAASVVDCGFRAPVG